MLRRKAFKFRLEPKPAARILLAQFAGCCRLVFNKALALQKELLEAEKSCLSYNKLAGKLRCWKQEKEWLFLKKCHSQPLQQTLMNLDNRTRQERFLCVECGYKENADFVGALNVLRAGHARLACGDIDLVGGLAQEPAQLATALA